MSAFRHILVATALGQGDVPALRYTRLLAERLNAEVTVLYSNAAADPLGLIAVPGSRYFTWQEEYGQQLEEDIAQFAGTHLGDHAFAIDIAAGPPAYSILIEAESRHADLIVLGGHHLRGWRRAISGSTTGGVTHGSRIPVLSVNVPQPGASPHNLIRRVLCPVNLTTLSFIALRTAARLARAFDSELIAIHVVENGQSPEVAERQVRERLAPEPPDLVTFRQLVLRGGAAERVLDCAEDLDADLLVVGAHQKPFRDTTVIGSTTERLLRFSSCPVLVVPDVRVAEASHQPAVPLSVVL